MKRYFLIIMMFAIIPFASGQIAEDEQGLFYNENNELYNGTYTEYFESGTWLVYDENGNVSKRNTFEK